MKKREKMSRSSSDHLQKQDRLCRRGMRTAAAVLMLMLLVFMMPVCAFADEGGFTTPAYNVDVNVGENHVIHVSEEINVDFYQSRHGIYRYIPDGGKYYGISNIRVQGYDYEVYSEGDSEVVKIGNPNYTVYGQQVYRISYDIVGYKDDDSTKDMLSMNLIPTGWNSAIDSASVTMTLPKAVKEIRTYSGQYGDTSSEGYFRTSFDGTEYKAVSDGWLPQGVGLTVSADLPEGYWVNPYTRDSARPKICGGIGIMGVLMLLLWFLVGRDDPVIRTVEFYPPEDMDPLEIAYIANSAVSTRDIPALFLYLASKGYAKVIQENEKRFRMLKVRDLSPEEAGHTRNLFEAMFSRGNEVSLRNLPSRFGDAAVETAGQVRRAMENRRRSFSMVSLMGRRLGLLFCFAIPLITGLAYAWLTFGARGDMLLMSFVLSLVIVLSMASLVSRTDMFRTKKSPVRIAVGFIIFLAAVFFETIAVSTDYPVLALVFMLSVLAAGIATIFVRRRMNNEIYGRVLGFRDFIQTAEYDRLKMLSEENPEYFFDIMPYASVFGMSTKWADKFADFRIPQPSWYQSPGGYYDPYFPHHMIIYSNAGVTSVVADHYKSIGADVVSSSSSTFSGGFGGGGFSGGGFGGGGGGSW